MQRVSEMSTYAWALLAIVLLGVALRLGHYLADPSVWHDEAALMMSVLETPWDGVLGPLVWNEAAPPLFVVVEKAMTQGLGTSTHVFRLIPLVASCLSLLLVAIMARRWLDPRAALVAVALYSFSDRMLWHSCEAKPYAVDALIAAAAMYWVGTTNDANLTRRLALLTMLAPVAIWISFPACFVVGGSLLAIVGLVWKSRSTGTWFAGIVCGMTTLVSFALLALGPVRAQRTGAMESCWTGYFPDWSRPSSVPFWIVDSSIGAVDYGMRPIGGVLVVMVILGAWSLWRTGKGSLLAGSVAPAALALLASLIAAYPFGGARVVAFLTPAFAFLAGAGVSFLVHHSGALTRWLQWMPATIAAVAIGFGVAGFIRPWPRADVKTAVELVRAQMRPDDQITSNAWESNYYFRRDSRFEPNVPAAFESSGRTWLVFVCEGDEVRAKLLAQSTPSGWRRIRQHELQYTSVVLLQSEAKKTDMFTSKPSEPQRR